MKLSPGKSILRIYYYLQLVRWPNLLIVIATQYIIRYFVIRPVLYQHAFQLQLEHSVFILLVLASVLIAGSGYVINDYFDRNIDIVNKPDRVIVGPKINRRSAIVLHLVMNFIAIVLGAYVSYRVGKIYYAIIFPMLGGVLWFYSTTYKKQLLIGNTIIALLISLVPFIVLLFEFPLLFKVYNNLGICTSQLLTWVLGYSGFAFLLTMIREIVKDIEDIEGDSIVKAQTLPAVIGSIITKIICNGLILFTIISILFVYLRFINDQFTLLYMLFVIFFPFIICFTLIIIANTKKQYHIISTILKVIMVLGLLYAPINYFFN